ncbi:Class II receptor tyrosine kinase [Geodia barretti]|uniref:Class II receptor tyrosine kinase n=1 Tax=Geodia barretti TaxID=519541 RepID=A0AA35SLW4_GEOBA|nr:Class II receptor tyrosine kinase [Geodia barretti]
MASRQWLCGTPFSATDISTVSYIEVYFLSLPSAKIGPPETTRIATDLNPRVEDTFIPQNCSFSSSTNTLTRNTFTLPQNPDDNVLEITFDFNQDTDWLFISEIQLCAGDPPSSISCGSPTTDPTPTPSPPPSPTPPSLTLSSPPPTGATESPDLGQPDSVSLTCSVASPPTGDYQYQWQWWRNGTPLSNTDTRFSITHSTNTQSSSLVISGLRYSDAGDYMCTVEYGACPDGVDCSGTTPVTGNIHLDLPLIVEVESSGLVVREGSEVIVLTCEVYGYPRDSSPPKWSSPGRNLETRRFITTLSDTGPLSGGSVSSTDKVTVSQLTIVNVTEADQGEYTCSVDGESASFRVDLGKLLFIASYLHIHQRICSIVSDWCSGGDWLYCSSSQ